ncbi:MAG: SURF1 family cytochrome oxidase biogenesis protein, partial [Pseudomonadota bacterium]
MSSMKKSTSLVLVTIVMLGALAALIALGTWQVIRLEWKTDLIAQTQARVAAEPQPLADV